MTELDRNVKEEEKAAIARIEAVEKRQLTQWRMKHWTAKADAFAAESQYRSVVTFVGACGQVVHWALSRGGLDW